MKEDWENWPINQICQIRPPKDEVRSRLAANDEVSFVPMENLGIEQKRLDLKEVKMLSEVEGSYTYFADKDVLLAKITPCFENGKLGIASNLVNGVGFGSSEYMVFRPDQRLSPDWLYYYLSRETFRLEGAQHMSGAVGHKRVNKDFVEHYLIPIPSPREQERLVGILDKAFADLAKAKALAERNRQNAKGIFDSYLNTIFGLSNPEWVKSTIGKCIHFIDYRGKTPIKTSTGLRLITAKNVKMGFLREEPKEYINPESYKSWMTRGIPEFGDVLFTTEAPLANIAQLDTDQKVAFAQRIIIMQPNKLELDSTFLKYLLLSQPIQKKIHSKGTGATVKGIKASLLKTIEISFPKAMDEQKQIVAKLNDLLNDVRQLESNCSRKIQYLDELKQSLLHQAFTGQL